MSSREYTDLHSHLLWQVDDGPEDFVQTRSLIRAALKNRVSCLCVTPHINRNGNRDIVRTMETADQRFGQLKNYVEEKKMPLEIVQGYEVYFSCDILFQSQEVLKKLCLGNSTYMLVELPFESFSPGVIDGISEIRKRGFDPIIAHPERCPELADNPELLIEMVSRDVLLQVNVESVLGMNGAAIRELTGRLIRAGLVHVIASDTHCAGDAYAGLERCFDQVARWTCSGFARQLMQVNPQRVLDNHLVFEPDEIFPEFLLKRKSRWSRIFSSAPGKARKKTAEYHAKKTD